MLIPATTPYEVRYEGTHPNGEVYKYTGPAVVAWDAEDGTPWIVGDRGLIPVTKYRNFIGVVEADSPVVAVIPGGEWRYETEWEGRTSPSSPILVWLVRANGQVDPFDSDSEGFVDDVSRLSNFKRLFHPDWDLASGDE